MSASKKPAGWCRGGCLQQNSGLWEPDPGASVSPSSLARPIEQEESGPGLETLKPTEKWLEATEQGQPVGSRKTNPDTPRDAQDAHKA